jgi:release factor glutamine methyltransferase
LVEAALRHLAAFRRVGERARIVDLCSGSAAMTVSLAIEACDADVVGLEFVEPAFEWGRRTGEAFAVAIAEAGSTLDLRQGDVRECEQRELADWVGTVDVVVSNPPYIPTWAVPRDPEVHLHEPAEALYGGEDGMQFVGAVVDAGRALLKPGGLLVIEHGDVQGEDGDVSVPRMVREMGGFESVVDHLDLAGRPRYTTAIRA